MEQTDYIKKIFWNKTFPILRNKYTITLLLFTVWIVLFDQNNLLDRLSNVKKLNQLNQKKEYFKSKIHKDQVDMQELVSDKENLEKFARENYLMKKDNEDVFIVIEE